MKLFNNHVYLILRIEKEDIDGYLDLIEKHNIPLLFPNYFDDRDCDYPQVCIDDEWAGGHLMSMICYYEISVIRNKKYRVVNNFKELKEYVDLADKRIEHKFLTVKDRKEYFDYLESLDDESLKNEYQLVKNLVAYIDNYCLKVKNTIENDILSGIKEDLLKEKVTKEDVYIYLNKLVDLRENIDDFINTDVYLFESNKEDYDYDDLSHLSKNEIKKFLIDSYEEFTYCDRNRLRTLKAIYENTDLIFNLFNFKLKAEGMISLDSCVFDTLRQLGYYTSIPDYLVGKRINKKWNYKSVLDNLLYTLQLIDCYPITSNSVIQIKINENGKEVEHFAKFLISLGFKDVDKMEETTCREPLPAGIIIDTNSKSFRSSSSGTIMSCMCSANRRSPLTIDDFMKHYEKIIINHDFVYHNLLYKELGYHYDSSLDEICKQAESRYGQ